LQDEPPTVACNLRLSTVKPVDNTERKYCFAVISPMRSYVLQAENELDYTSWIAVLQNAIGAGSPFDFLAPPLLFLYSTKRVINLK